MGAGTGRLTGLGLADPLSLLRYTTGGGRSSIAITARTGDPYSDMVAVCEGDIEVPVQ